MESSILEAEELSININEILLPSITNTETKIEILSQEIEDYIPPKSSDNSNKDLVEEDNNSAEIDEELPQEYYGETEADISNSITDNVCYPIREDCNGDGEIDSPPSKEPLQKMEKEQHTFINNPFKTKMITEKNEHNI